MSGVLKVVWAIWFGPLPTGARLAAMQTLNNTNVPVRMINSSNWLDVELPDHPFPRALLLPGLSEIHRADYLRAYLMNHYGGGYTDVKPTGSSWANAWDEFNNPDVWIVGTPERGRFDIACSNGVVNLTCTKIGDAWQKLAANSAYIMRDHTPVTAAWLREATRRLVLHGPMVMRHPAHRPRCCQESNPNQYPLRWAELHGEILHPLMAVYRKHIRLSLPRWLDGPYRGNE